MRILAALLILMFVPSAAAAAPKADLWPYWTAHNPQSERRVDHGFWDDFLQRYVVRGEEGVNLVAYGRVSEKDKQGLEGYIQRLTRIPVRDLSRPEQFALWVNLYNALTVELILDRYPVESIRDIDISPGWFSQGPWDKKLVNVEGREVSLNDIEHRILRPIWEDPRIHYAVNCAAMGCPDLRRKAYTAANTEQLLRTGAGRYINHPRGATIREGKLVVSSIYTWYRADFGGSERGVIEHLQRYADSGLKAKLKGLRGIDGYRYDWSLNDASEKR